MLDENVGYHAACGERQKIKSDLRDFSPAQSEGFDVSEEPITACPIHPKLNA
jgi:hypothetical protein